MKLIDRLKEYGQEGWYPFHMPGHKRQEKLGITSFPNPFSVDITEIEGFDNLHHPEGILKEAMEEAARLYGSDRTYFLVNGSSCGILSAMGACALRGGTILMAGNSHKAAYHGLLLNGLKAACLAPEILPGWGIQGSLAPKTVRQALEENGRAEAVFVTSPTYEGILSDIGAIAELAHRAGIPLIVDEAHGAHFSFQREQGGRFPCSALGAGADVVIQSLHKTLPSLTQTAVLHVKGGLVDRGRLERCLAIYQSSSPSYVLMASIDSCIRYMGGRGREELQNFGKRLELWEQEASRWKVLRLLDSRQIGGACMFGKDLSKLVVSPARGGMTGTELGRIVRERYRLEPEMSCREYVIFMTSLMDQEEGLKRLMEGLNQVDRELWEQRGTEKTEREGSKDKKEAGTAAETESNTGLDRTASPGFSYSRIVDGRLLEKAWESPGEKIPLEKAGGRVSRSFLTVYPPGIPAAVPGEELTEELTEALLYGRQLGLTVEGVYEDGTVEVLKANERMGEQEEEF